MGGVCATCLNSPVTDDALPVTGPAAPVKKLRPLLCNLEADFKEFAGADGVLDTQELTAIWKKCAERKVGKLSDEDLRVIADSSRSFFATMDIQKDGKVTYEEFITYMMGGTESRGPLHNMRDELAKSLKNDPNQMTALIQKFKSWDKNGDGFVTPDEFDEHLHELQDIIARQSNQNKRRADQEAEDFKILKKQLFEEADVDKDGKVDMWELMAHTLGRRKIPVEIMLYDVSGGMADKLGKLLVGKNVIAAHSSVLVYGCEYWYGGQLFRSNPPCSKAFGQPLSAPWGAPLQKSEVRPDIPVIPAGYTFATQAEFADWMKNSGIMGRYSKLEQYDLLTHSCHHFTNEILTFLTGSGLPEKIFELQRMAMTPTVLALRPALNKFLGGFGDAGKAIDDKFFTVEDTEGPSLATSQSECEAMSEVLGAGSVVTVENVDGVDGSVVATILKDEGGTCDIKYFDPVSGAINFKNGVRSSQIKPIG